MEQALQLGQPQIFNSDQGSQFTSEAFTSYLENKQIAISQDGIGWLFDNIFVERLWRSVKYEEVYLKEYRTGAFSGWGSTENSRNLQISIDLKWA